MEARQAELVDVTAEQQARDAQATELDRQIAETERRLQVRLMILVTLSGRACMRWLFNVGSTHSHHAEHTRR